VEKSLGIERRVVLTDTCPGVVWLQSVVHVSVVEEKVEHRVEPGPVLGMSEPNEGLDPSHEVPNHQVGRANEMQRLVAVMAVIEPIDTRVLEISPEYGTNRDVLGESVDAGS
jgi:hypothetical protein